MRVKQGSPVIIQDDRSGYQYPASMHECGKEGLYLEANYAPRPGSTFKILFGNRELGAGPCDRKEHQAEVRIPVTGGWELAEGTL